MGFEKLLQRLLGGIFFSGFFSFLKNCLKENNSEKIEAEKGFFFSFFWRDFFSDLQNFWELWILGFLKNSFERERKGGSLSGFIL